eukprot:g7920.t1 g7920   contig26:569551-571245(+)
MAPYEPHHLSQILSLLDDSQSCITLRTIMLELGVNRLIAREILNDVVVGRCTSDDNGGGGEKKKKYQVTRMVATKMDGSDRTCVQLVVDGGDEGVVFSIAPLPPPDGDSTATNDVDEDDVDEDGNPIIGRGSTNNTNNNNNNNNSGDKDKIKEAISIVSSAHEKALSIQRDKLLEGDDAELFTLFAEGAGACVMTMGDADDDDGKPFCNADIGGCIHPAYELFQDASNRIVRRVKRGRDASSMTVFSSKGANNGGWGGGGGGGGGGRSRFNGSGGEGNKSTIGGSTSSKMGSGAKSSKGKPTTAAAFFGSTSSGGSGGGMKKKEAKKSAAAADKKVSEKKQDDNDSEPKSTEGNADDFLGDMDEDEIDIQAEKERKARVAKEARKTARAQMNDEGVKKRNVDGGGATRRSCVDPEKRKRAENDGNDDGDNVGGKGGDASDEEVDDDVKAKKTGAMDEFAKKTESKANNSNGNGGATKRRKKLIEQTVEDENGYLRTETVTVWEEIADGEAVVEKPKAKPAVKSSGSSAKSGGGGGANKGSGKGGKGVAAGGKKQAGLMGFFKKK